MTSIFEVETIVTKWDPPFDKTNTTKVFNVNPGELFDMEDRIKEDVFMLESEQGDSAIIKYDNRFIPKKGIYAANINSLGSQTMKLHHGDPVEFSFMWGNFGITKKITYQGMNGSKPEIKDEPEEPKEEIMEDEY